MTAQDDFFDAAKTGDLATLKRLAPRVKVNARRGIGWTALHYVMTNTKINSKKKPLPLAKELIARGADVNAAAENGQTPIIDAAAEGFADVVELLCEHGADVNARLDTGANALHCLAQELKDRPRNVRVTVARKGKKVTLKSRAAVKKVLGGHPDEEYERYLATARVLIARGIDVTAKKKEYQQTALSDAADYGSAELCEMLLATGKLNPDLKDTWGMTPLQYACRNGYVDVVKVLLAAEADVNTADKVGFTPMHQAMEGRSAAVAKLLLAAGADPDRPLKKGYGEYAKGETARMTAARKKLRIKLPPP
jgi:ankyrin repeat protein